MTILNSVAGAATEYTARVMHLGMALMAVFFGAAEIGAITAQSARLAPEWQFPALAALALLPLTIACGSFALPMRVLRALSLATAIAYLVALATWPLAFEPGDPLAGPPWIIAFSGTSVAFAALVLRPPLAWGLVAVVAVGLGVVRYLADGSAHPTPAMPFNDAAFRTVMSCVIVGVIVVTLRAGRARDAIAAQVAAELAEASAASARNATRARSIAFIHDTVIVTLIAAARYGDEHASRVQGLARATLERLRPHADAPGALEAPTHELLAALLRESADAHGLPVSTSGPPTAMPAEAFEALLAAATEALRNARRHAGAHAGIGVDVRGTGHAVTVTIVDDGIGFDPRHRRPERFGVSVSILRRMQSIRGGTASVRSRPGDGTRVDLGWSTR